MAVSTEQRIAADRLHAFALDCLAALGMPAEDAAITADAMIWAGLRGKSGHGVIRLAMIAQRARGGELKLSVDWTPIDERAGTTLLDAHSAWGVVAGRRGMGLAVQKAKAGGVGLTVVRNTDVTSAIGMYPEVALDARMIGMAISNTQPMMPPTGGRTKSLGSQPFSIGVPAGRHAPLLLDMATTAIPSGEVVRCAASGEPLPEGAGADAEGTPTTDARAVLEGMMLPMGGYRGYALALMWETLTGVLGGGLFLTQLGANSKDQLGVGMGTSLFLLAIDPAAFMPYEAFVARIDELIDEMHASPPAPGVERVRVPGERGAQNEARNRREGIPVAIDHVDKLRALGSELGIAWPT